MIEQEIMTGEPCRRAIAAQPTQTSIENFRRGHRGLVPRRQAGNKRFMVEIARTTFGLLTMPGRVALNLALPPRCQSCGALTLADHLFCLECWQKIDFLGGPACRLCGDPFALDHGPEALCGACLADTPHIDGMRAAVAYGNIARTLALRLKYGGRPGIAKTLAKQMRRLVVDTDDALMVPVPLHRWRLWRRGYNQAVLIARALARETGLPFVADALLRTKQTPILRGMGPADRRTAVRGAFSIAKHRKHHVKGRAIILIDDIYTTGATANACARALKRAGAASVTVCCWARVVRDIDNAAAR
jgi:ComF family protein